MYLWKNVLLYMFKGDRCGFLSDLHVHVHVGVCWVHASNNIAVLFCRSCVPVLTRMALIELRKRTSVTLCFERDMENVKRRRRRDT